MLPGLAGICVPHTPPSSRWEGHSPGDGAPPQTHRLKESVAPVLSVLTECARMHRPARKFLKAQVGQKWESGGWVLAGH